MREHVIVMIEHRAEIQHDMVVVDAGNHRRTALTQPLLQRLGGEQ